MNAEARKPQHNETINSNEVKHELGNPELPIADFRAQIVEAVNSSQAVVITAETGAGKSTQVPQFLAEAGYKVVVTQPRVVAARSVAERVEEEVVSSIGEAGRSYVGYRTARERNDSPDNQILFATDGLQLVRELSGRGSGYKTVLVLDEIHEWNENMEVLVAWAKQRMRQDPEFKVVTMSATVESEDLSEYFADGRREVPVVEVPGRTFEVKKREGGDVVNETIKFAREGKNVLVFVPGKAEIDRVASQLESANIPDATILPLHGQMDSKEQRKVFVEYDGVKIVVATNVAQTSVTIPDIAAVVDSGLERTNQVRGGVEGLYLNPISKADCLQRAGRAGRTKEGEYVLAKLYDNPFVPMDERSDYGIPEIERVRLDGMVLRVAKAGYDASEMEFYHQPDPNEISQAKRRLEKLGALREDGSVTKIGRDMDRMPVESHYARMMIEARKYNSEVQVQLAALLAIQEAGGICRYSSRSRPCDENWRYLILSHTNDSDMLAQLEVFVRAQSMSKQERDRHDIIGKFYHNANITMRQLRYIEGLQDVNISVPTEEQREQLVKCIIAGMVDHLYTRNYHGHFVDSAGNIRDANNRSIIQPGNTVVGMPFDLQINTRRGLTTLNLIENITNVPSIDVLREVAPQLFARSEPRLVVDSSGRLVREYDVIFNGKKVDKSSEEIPPSRERNELYARHMVTQRRDLLVGEIDERIRDLSDRSGLDIPVFDDEVILQRLLKVMPKYVENIADVEALDIGLDITEIIPQNIIDEIMQLSPDNYGGMELYYSAGEVIAEDLDIEKSEDLPSEEFDRLPDGRDVKAYHNWEYLPLSEIRESLIAKEAAAREKQKLQDKALSLKETIGSFDLEKSSSNIVNRRFDLLNEIDQILNGDDDFEVRDRALDAMIGRIDAYRLDIEKDLVAIQQRERERAAAEARGLPRELEVYNRQGGSTNNSIAYVIDSDGRLVPPDGYKRAQGGHTDRWSKSLSGDQLIVTHKKPYTAAEHEFGVEYTPENLTEAQIAKLKELQAEIEERWSGRQGMSGKTSPSVGLGWFDNPDIAAFSETAPTEETVPDQSMDDMLAKLAARFNR